MRRGTGARRVAAGTLALAMTALVGCRGAEPPEPSDSTAADADPADPSASAALEGGFAFPEEFGADPAWERDTSSEAQAQIAEAFGEGREDASQAAVYLPSDGSADPLVAAVEPGEAYAGLPLEDAAGASVEASLAQQIVQGTLNDGGGVACGALPVLTEDQSRRTQWICAVARGSSVILLGWPLPVADGDSAVALTRTFYEAAAT